MTTVTLVVSAEAIALVTVTRMIELIAARVREALRAAFTERMCMITLHITIAWVVMKAWIVVRV